MKVLSLFDGISCLRVALGSKVVEYHASEIDKNAIKISTKNYPDIKRLGSVCDVSGFTCVDLLVGGSPCTDLSKAKKDREGLKGSHSKLFYEYVRIWKETKPTWFILENVASMPEKDKEIITSILGVEPIMINASLVSAQSRKRYFWTNIPVKGLPADRGILLKDILQNEVDDKYYIKNKTMTIKPKHSLLSDFKQVGHVGANNDSKVGGQALRIYDPEYKSSTLGTGGAGLIQIGHIGDVNAQANRVYSTDGKTSTLVASAGGLGAKTGLYQTTRGMSIRGYLKEGKWVDTLDVRRDEKTSALTSSQGSKLALVGKLDGDITVEQAKKNEKIEVKVDPKSIRRLTPIECERLQSLPDNYTDGISMTARYKALGNAFNVEVIKFILSFIPT